MTVEANKNIMIIDGADNCAFDIFQATNDEFTKIFPNKGQDIAFIEDLEREQEVGNLNLKFLSSLWNRPVHKSQAQGIHGILFYQLEHKKQYYPNFRDTDLDFVGRQFSSNDLLGV